MIDGIATLHLPVRDSVLDWLRAVTSTTAPQVHIGSTAVVPAAPDAAVRVDFATSSPEELLRRSRRRGLSVNEAAQTIDCRGLRFGVRHTVAVTSQRSAEQEVAHDVVHGLDHIVVHTADAAAAVEGYGGRLGLDLRLDRSAPQWGGQMMFFRAGSVVWEVIAPPSDAPAPHRDVIWGLALQVRSIAALRERISDGEVQIGEPRDGRKPGTRVASVHGSELPMLLVEPADRKVTDR